MHTIKTNWEDTGCKWLRNECMVKKTQMKEWKFGLIEDVDLVG